MRGLASRTVRRRPAAFVAMFVTIAAAATLLSATLNLQLTGSLPQPTATAYPGIDALVISPPPPAAEPDPDLPEPLAELVHRIEAFFEPQYQVADRTGGVDAAVVEAVENLDRVDEVLVHVRFPAGLATLDGDPIETRQASTHLGRGWSSARIEGYELTSGRAPGAAGEIVIDVETAQRAHIDVGDQVRMVTTNPAGVVTVVGLASRPEMDTDPRTSAVFVDDSQIHEVAQLRGSDVSAVGVVATAGTTRNQLLVALRSVVGDHEVLDRGRLLEHADPAMTTARQQLRLLGSSIAGVVLSVVVIVIVSVMGVALRQRRRELILLRTLGGTPRSVGRMLGREVAVTAAAAALFGAPLGVLLGRRAITYLAGGGVLPTPLEPVGSVAAALTGAAMVVAIAWLTARASAWFVLRHSPLHAMAQEANAGQRQLGAVRRRSGITCLVVGLAALIVPPLLVGPIGGLAGAGGATLLIIVAIALLGPWLVADVARRRRPDRQERGGVSTLLASANMAARSRTTAALCTTLVLAGALPAVGIAAQQQELAASRSELQAATLADAVLSGSLAGLPEAIVEELDELPGVAATVATRRQPLMLSYREFGLGSDTVRETVDALIVDDADDLHLLIDVGLIEGQVASIGADTVLLGRQQAGLAGVSVDDHITVTLPDMTSREVRVGGIYRRDAAFGPVIASSELLDGHVDGVVLDTVHLATTAGTTGGQLRTQLGSLRDLYPGLVNRTPLDLLAVSEPGAWDAWGINAIVLLAIALLTYIGVVNALAAAVLGRVKEFTLLRLAGTSRRQVIAAVRQETALLGGLAAALSAVTIVLATVAVEVAVAGWQVPRVSPSLIILVLSVPFVLLVLTGEVMVRVALRQGGSVASPERSSDLPRRSNAYST